ncbi:MAG: hypothetical protein K2Y40_21215 [Reyranella sp.]|nr:hypothetical protein [Reyranella sp.]
MFKTMRLTVVALAGSFLAAGSAFAQGAAGTTPIVGISTVTNYSVDGRVTAIDPATRNVTLTTPNGSTVSRKVSPDITNLGVVKVGDDVFVGYEEKFTFVLSGPNARPPRDRDNSVVVGTAGPKAEAGVALNQLVANWWVVGVDPAAGRISLVNPAGGEVRTFGVSAAEARAQLPRIKNGDYLTAIDSTILVVSILPKK